MRMSDIIRIGSKKTATKKRFVYNPSVAVKKNNGLQMKRLSASEEGFSDEHKTMEGFYQQYLKEIRLIFNRAIVNFNILPPISLIQNLAIGIADKLQLCNVDIMDFFMKSEPEEENYIYSHSVNVAFLSVMLGVWLNYNKSELSQLAIAATLHDIGMINVLDIASLPRGLNPKERKEVEEHPNYSREFLQQIQGIDDKIIEAVYNHHKRLDSQARAIIGEYSQVIGLVDIFEAMTHPRTYKKAQEPHSVIRSIINELKSGFDSKIVKALIDNIGIYPVGTLVRLDTEEIGLVIDVNQGSPLSPKVNILFKKDAKRLAEPRTVDLSKQQNLHIANPLEKETEHHLKELIFSK